MVIDPTRTRSKRRQLSVLVASGRHYGGGSRFWRPEATNTLQPASGLLIGRVGATHRKYIEMTTMIRFLWLGCIVASTCLPQIQLANAQSDNLSVTEQAALENRLEQYALRTAGDSAAGKLLFENTTKTKCGLCHVVGGTGGKIGPDLSAIGGKFDRGHLVESLLDPTKQIVEGYRGWSVLTKDGSVLRGVIVKQNDESVTVADADAKQTTIARDKIEQIKPDATSIMPTGLANSLTPDEFTNLIAYLETLRSGGKSGAGSDIQGPIALSEDYSVQVVATGMSGATQMEVLPDGRILVCEQMGSVRVVKDGKLLKQPMLSLPVDHLWERGIIGITADPEFDTTQHIYVCWTGKLPYSHHRVSRFKLDGDKAIMNSEKVLLEGDDQSKMGGNVPAGHQGGGLHFGSDGKLYIAIGEQTAGSPSQSLDTFLGKMLRINPDGTIPNDNPLLDKTSGKYQAIWTYGMRNPFTFAVRASDGLMLINDVGGKFEEINVGHPGRNYGWPLVPHGPVSAHRASDLTDAPEIANTVDPIHWYPEASISGGDFLQTNLFDSKKASRWPKSLQGRYFFADFKHGWIHTIDPDNARKATEFASGLRRPVDLRFGPDGTLFVLLRNAWVIDDKFQGSTSSLLAISPKN